MMLMTVVLCRVWRALRLSLLRSQRVHALIFLLDARREYVHTRLVVCVHYVDLGFLIVNIFDCNGGSCLHDVCPAPARRFLDPYIQLQDNPAVWLVNSAGCVPVFSCSCHPRALLVDQKYSFQPSVANLRIKSF